MSFDVTNMHFYQPFTGPEYYLTAAGIGDAYGSADSVLRGFKYADRQLPSDLDGLISGLFGGSGSPSYIAPAPYAEALNTVGPLSFSFNVGEFLQSIRQGLIGPQFTTVR